MLLKIIWKKIHFYKRFELDIWGFNLIGSITNKKILNILNNKNKLLYVNKNLGKKNSRYIYRIDVDQPIKFKRKQKWKFLTKKISRLFYLTLSYNQFRKLLKIASRSEGSRESNFIMLVENRVIFMLYRMNFLFNIFELRNFVLNGNVYLNNKIVNHCNLSVKYGEIITLRKNISKIIKLNIIKRFVKEGFYFNIPRYLYVNYKLMFGFAYREPKIKDLTFPINSIDIYRCADLF